MKTLLLGMSPDNIAPEHLARARALASEYQVLITDDADEMRAALDRIEIAAGRLPRNLMMTAPNLRWFQQWGAGADWLMSYPEALERPFVLTNASGIHTIQISEHIVGMMLTLTRKLDQAACQQRQHIWQRPERSEMGELYGATAVMLGLGAIGARTAHLLHAFDMHLIGVRRNPFLLVEGVERIVGPDQLHDVLPKADWLVITAPLTPETKGIISAEALALMKPTARIANIGRGPIIDQDALVAALQAGELGGAALDVTTPEPLDEDSALWDMPNVLISPHYSGSTIHYEERAWALFLDNLARYVKGERLLNVVDKQLAYAPPEA